MINTFSKNENLRIIGAHFSPGTAKDNILLTEIRAKGSFNLYTFEIAKETYLPLDYAKDIVGSLCYPSSPFAKPQLVKFNGYWTHIWERPVNQLLIKDHICGVTKTVIAAVYTFSDLIISHNHYKDGERIVAAIKLESNEAEDQLIFIEVNSIDSAEQLIKDFPKGEPARIDTQDIIIGGRKYKRTRPQNFCDRRA